MQIIELPPSFDGYAEHDHTGSGQEEVYVVLRGSGEIEIDGERLALDPETLVRVGATARRKIYSGPQGLRLLALGGVPGKAYKPPHFTELGAPDLRRLVPSRRIHELLLDPQCPFAVVLARIKVTRRRGPGPSRVITMEDLYRFAQGRLGDIPGLDERLDQFLTHAGARRRRILDPWAAPRRVVRRLLGRSNPERVCYELPDSLFSDLRT